MTAAERRALLKNIIETGTPRMTGIPLTYNGERKEFNAYAIPLENLVYNPYNGRIGSVVKSYERQHHTLDPENPEDVKIIEEFLWKSKETANDKTLQSLRRDHQQRYGIVTSDGVIIDGNRRASLLNKIYRDETIPANEKAHARFFLAIILPGDADRKEILRLETTYQMGEDPKLDYNPIEKYLKIRDLANEGFSNKEIAEFMAITPRKVTDYLNVLTLMDEYLETYGYTGIYTAIGTREDPFQKLEASLRAYAAGGVASMWGYNPEADVSDLKSIAFDFMRSGLEQFDFRDIIRKPNKTTGATASIFANEQIWRDFSNKHFELVDGIQEKSLEEYIEGNSGGDVTRSIIARDTTWKKKIGEQMQENFTHAKDILINRQHAAEPKKLIKKALEALTEVDTTQDSFKTSLEVKGLVAELETILQSFNDVLKS